MANTILKWEAAGEAPTICQRTAVPEALNISADKKQFNKLL